MNWKDAQKIIANNQMIMGAVSKYVLSAIRYNSPIHPDNLPFNISVEQIEALREKYQQVSKRQALQLQSQPRNFIFYEILKEKIPYFTWTTQGKNVVFQAPKIANKIEPSLLHLLLNAVDEEKEPLLRKHYPFLSEFNSVLIEELGNLFIHLEVIYPEEQHMIEIMHWLQAGLRGEKLYLFSLVCPDYSVEAIEPIDNSRVQFKHTFNALGSGVGLMAKRILQALPLIKNFLSKWNIDFISVVAMANYEALSIANLNRLKITAEDFLAHLKCSQQAVLQQSFVTIQNPMITDLCGGHENWKSLYTHYRNQFKKNNFGQSQLNSMQLIAIAKARKQLYDQWHGSQNNLENYVSLLLDQGAEYAAVGALIRKHYPNCLILGADHNVFCPFYSVDNFSPAIYLKRFYC